MNWRRAYLKNHSCNLHATLCGIFYFHSIDVARYAALIQEKSPTNCDAHLAESLFQTHSRKEGKTKHLSDLLFVMSDVKIRRKHLS